MVSAQEVYFNDDVGGISGRNQGGSANESLNNVCNLGRIPRKSKSTSANETNTQITVDVFAKSNEAAEPADAQDETDVKPAPEPSTATETTEEMKLAAKTSHTLEAWKNYDLDKPKLPILRKGDLVRISQE